MSSNNNVLKDRIDKRDGIKVCVSLGLFNRIEAFRPGIHVHSEIWDLHNRRYESPDL